MAENMARRSFLRGVGAGAAALASARLGQGASPARRPNFLFILTDDQRYDALGFVQRLQGDKARFPWLRTPNLDRLAAEGVWFRQAFVANSLCSPSRACFLTGQHSHVNGIVNNHTPFNPENVTHASVLGKAGWRTGYIGKWHMGSQSGQRPGFDWSASFVGQGVYHDCPFEINGVSKPTKGYIDDVSTDFAEQFIKDNRERPWLLCVGYKAAHGPFTPPARREQDYAGEQARSVPNLAVGAIYRPEAKPPAEPPANVKALLPYFRTLTGMDDNVGRLLKLLDDLKLTDDTMVVFAGDNGFYLGEHGLGDKRTAYDESLRIPLLLRYPRLGLKGHAVDGLALNIDLAPTFLDYAGVPVPKTMQGASWRPLLEGKTEGWRQAIFSCYYWERGFVGIPTTSAVRTANAKLIKYPGHDEWTEVFDLAADPYELKNLANDPARSELRRSLEAEYARQTAAIGWRIPPFADQVAAGQGAAGQGGQPLGAWVLDYRFDRDEGDKVVDASGKGHHGLAKGCRLVDGRDGRKARRFDGQAAIEVDKAPALNPAVSAWTLEATFKADQPDGVVLARGGETQGYRLRLAGGKPVLEVAGHRELSTCAAKDEVTGRWVTVRGLIDAAGHRLVLLIDGKQAAQGRLRRAIGDDPNDTMQIGADEGSPVGATAQPRFVGLIESVRLYSGSAP